MTRVVALLAMLARPVAPALPPDHPALRPQTEMGVPPARSKFEGVMREAMLLHNAKESFSEVIGRHVCTDAQLGTVEAIMRRFQPELHANWVSASAQTWQRLLTDLEDELGKLTCWHAYVKHRKGGKAGDKPEQNPGHAKQRLQLGDWESKGEL